MIYADNAATTPLDEEALDTMLPYLKDQFYNPSSLYTASVAVKKVIEASRKTIAKAIGADQQEIYFTSGGTESNNWAIKGSAIANKKKGKNIIVSSIEHHAVLNTCETLKNDGYSVSYLPVNKKGHIIMDDLIKVLTDGTTLVSIIFANNEIGTIQDLATIAAILKNKNILLHTDAVQAVGHLEINVKKLGVDLLSASAHKFNGPKGVGFLYIKNGLKIENLICGGGQERQKRAGTENVAGIVAMAVALENNLKKIDEQTTHLKKLEKATIALLQQQKIDFLINGSDTEKLPGNINISFKNIDGEALLHLLDLKNICISTGSACDSSSKNVSHVIKAIDVPSEYQHGTLRISYGKQNTIDDARKIVEAIVWACNKQRNSGKK